MMMTSAPANARSSTWDIFMIVALVVALFYLVSFGIRYPEYWYAVTLFVIICVVGILKRAAALSEARRSTGPRGVDDGSGPSEAQSEGTAIESDTDEYHRSR